MTDYKTCISDTKDAVTLAKIEAYLKTFPDIKSFEAHERSDIFWNSVSIGKETIALDEAKNAGNWLKVGQEAGLMLDQVIIGSSDPHVGEVPADVKIAGKVVVGILKGAIDAEGLDDIEMCIHDSTTIVKDVSAAITDFKKKDATAILEGLKLLSEGVFKIRHALTDCRGVEANFVKLEKLAAIFSNPASFAYHVGKDMIVNGVQIIHEVEDSETQFKS